MQKNYLAFDDNEVGVCTEEIGDGGRQLDRMKNEFIEFMGFIGFVGFRNSQLQKNKNNGFIEFMERFGEKKQKRSGTVHTVKLRPHVIFFKIGA